MSKPVIIGNATLYLGDCLQVLASLPDESVQCCVTSPPYFGLRDYGSANQIGLEETPEQYISKLSSVFNEVWRVLRPDGTLWLNLGDTYTSGNNPAWLKPKNLIGIPWRVALVLQSEGWYLRQDIIWHKPNPMPESVTDRCTKAHEYIFLLSKSERYLFDSEAIKEQSNGWKIGGAKTRGETDYASASGAGKSPQRDSNGGLGGDGKTRNCRSVWTVPTQPYSGAHFATFPPDLIRPCILAGSRPGDIVLDPFNGSGTSGAVSLGLGRHYIGVELNPDYLALAIQRITPAARQPDMFIAPVNPVHPVPKTSDLFDEAAA